VTEFIVMNLLGVILLSVILSVVLYSVTQLSHILMTVILFECQSVVECQTAMCHLLSLLSAN
jgi:hypothetical protein